MSNQPITLPPELRRSWLDEAWRKYPGNLSAWIEYVAEKSAQWSADMELEAVLAEMKVMHFSRAYIDKLRDARRPKPPSEAEQALELVSRIEKSESVWAMSELGTIRRALERLQKLEEKIND
jgi:hypothetical protein